MAFSLRGRRTKACSVPMILICKLLRGEYLVAIPLVNDEEVHCVEPNTPKKIFQGNVERVKSPAHNGPAPALRNMV